MRPLVSIVIPVYNVEKFLPECLDSILSQTLKEIEVIAVNDGSTDTSSELLDRYSKRDGRLKVIHKNNCGVSEARNEALKCAQGEFIGFVDSDDWIDPKMYEVMLRHANEKNLDIVMCGYVREFKDHAKMKIMDIEENRIFNKEEINRYIIRKMIGPVSGEPFITENLDMHSVVWNKLYRADLVRDLNFFSLREIGSCEDLLFNLSAFGKAGASMFINRPYYHYRKTSALSVTNRFRPYLVQQRIKLIEKIRDFINDYNLPKECQEALNNRICLGIMGLGLNIISPDNKSGVLTKIKHIKELLSDKRITLAFQTFNITGLPFHWKAFYTFARNRNAVCYYSMLRAISLMIFIVR